MGVGSVGARPDRDRGKQVGSRYGLAVQVTVKVQELPSGESLKMRGGARVRHRQGAGHGRADQGRSEVGPVARARRVPVRDAHAPGAALGEVLPGYVIWFLAGWREALRRQ